jgi:Family of unknown function (DUF6483)
MFKNDFIMRMIKQLANVLKKVINYKKSGQWEKAQMVIDVSVKQLLGLNPILLDKLDGNALVDLFSYDDEIDHQKCATLAVLLTEQAGIYENTMQSENKIFRLYQNSFSLYGAAFTDRQLHEENYLNYAVHCCDKLLEFQLETSLLLEIFNFYKELKFFSKAENVLYQLLEQNENEAKEHALKFYNQLLAQDDQVLQKGDLPREEVLEGLDKFSNLKR